jgi:uncharacterized secreted protein with C-terminal beta-propeller domain
MDTNASNNDSEILTKKPKSNFLFGVLLFFGVILLILIIYLTGNFDGVGLSVYNSNDEDSVKKVASCKDLEGAVNEYYTELDDWQKNGSGYYDKGGVMPLGMPETMSSREGVSAPMANKAADGSVTVDNVEYSSTNNQVKDVDEGDVVKTDGKYLYRFENGKVSVAEFDRQEGLFNYIGSITPEHDVASNFKLHLDGKVLTLIGNDYEADTFIGTYLIDEVAIRDLQAGNSPSAQRKIVLDGSLVDTRLYKGVLYVISRYGTDYGIDWAVEGTKGDPRVTNIENYLPKYLENGDSKSFASCGDLTLIYPMTEPTSFLNVISVDLKNSKAEVGKQTILGASDIMYMSTNNLYLAQTTYNNWWWAWRAVRENKQASDETNIFKFALKDAKVSFVNETTLTGTLVNQFAMDEYNENLRVALTKTAVDPCANSGNTRCQIPPNWQARSNLVKILDKNLKEIGAVEGLARGEQIFSARFIKDRGYLVTFKRTDPLFSLDLSNPSMPKAVGELKVPGFSNYLHPVFDNGYLIGVGKEANDQGVVQGLKISLFDVRDITNAKLVDSVEVGIAGTDSLVNQDHKAFLWDERNNLLVLPVDLFTKKSQPAGEWDMYGDLTFQGSYAYEITPGTGIAFKGRITHQTDRPRTITTKEKQLDDFGQVVDEKVTEEIISTVPPVDILGVRDEYRIDRQFYIDSFLITSSPKLWKSSRISNIVEVDALDI